MNTATAILPAAALCAALLLPVTGTADEAAPQTPPTPPGVRAEALDVRNGRSGNLLRGVLYRPEGAEGRLPVVLCAHEFGGDSRRPWCVRYATHLAGEGFAVYAFDFSGGGESSRSEGRTTEMSVMTEADDLESVLDAARGWDFADPARILLVGGSQGGAVSAVVAARRPDDIAALVLLYPALVIHDDVHKKYESLADVPDEVDYNGWIRVGRRYFADVWDFDFFAKMGDYKRPVLLVHGDGDAIVPLAYSERALATYPDARLVALKADTHVFPQPEVQAQCLVAVDAFLRETGLLPAASAPASAAADRIARNTAAMRRFETCINRNDLSLGRELISEKAAFATPVSPEPLHGAEGYLSVVTMMRESFPDVQWKLEDMVADEKTVAVRWTCSGTFTGKAPFAGVQPNGRAFSTSVMNFYVFDNEGKIVDDIAATGIAGIIQGITP